MPGKLLLITLWGCKMGFIEEAAFQFKIIDSLTDSRLADEFQRLQARCKGRKDESALDNLLLFHTRKVIVQRFLKRYGGIE